jgi:hypothetical protein
MLFDYHHSTPCPVMVAHLGGYEQDIPAQSSANDAVLLVEELLVSMISLRPAHA